VGLFSKRMKDPVRGTAQVVAASIPPRGVAGWSNCSLDLVVKAEGIQSYAKQMTSWMTPTSKWPYAGQTLPVTIDRADPDKVKIEWDVVRTSDEIGRAEAERIAESMQQHTGASPSSGRPEEIPPEAAAIVDQLKQIFPDAAVSVGEPVAVDLSGALAAASGDDSVSQLERLAKLHESGALTDEEFEAAKAQVLKDE
jgi:hypothetical protein